MAVAPADRTEHLTVVYDEAENGWIAARIEEIPGALSQGRTREEARQNVLAAAFDLAHEPSRLERTANRLRALVR